LRSALSIFSIVVIGLSAGCNGGKREVLTVDFQENQTLRYKFVSTRDVDVDLGGKKRKGSKAGSGKLEKSTESFEMIVAYQPIEVDPAFTKVKATCESVKIKRSKKNKSGRKDAAESLAGKSFTFTVGPSGVIEDYSDMDRVLKEAGENAFGSLSSKGRIKEPDMLEDFTATQWFLWDSVSSIAKPAKGVAVGASWESQMSVPDSMVLRKARNVTYTLEEIRESEDGRVAVINSVYSPAPKGDLGWPAPYIGKFQLSGPLGFFRMLSGGFNVKVLEGEGQELFNIDAGRSEGYNQHYRLELEARKEPLPNTRPKIVIDQKLTMQLLKKKK